MKGTPPGRSHSPQPERTASTAATDSAPAVSLEVLAFTRLAFGPTPADVAAYQALPGATPDARFEQWVRQQLDPASIDDSACDARLEAAGLDTLNRSRESLWDQYIARNKYAGMDKEYEYKYQPTDQSRAATLLRAVYSKRQLYEVLVDFWHNHFSVYPHDHEEIFTTWPAYDTGVIRANALGNFRVMLEAVAQSTAMLYYLDNATSQDTGPNENFARELLELHTLGAENYLGTRSPQEVPRGAGGIAMGYVDNDVYEVARCFTGWTFDMNAEWWGMGNTGAFLYKKDWHDRFNKLVLGKLLPADQSDLKDGRDVLDLLASHPGTARHIAGKLCRRLIGDAPSRRIIQEAAGVFLAQRNAPDQLAQVVRAIVLSPEFKQTFGEKIKRPFEAATGTLRAFNADLPHPRLMLWAYDAMGQPVFGRRPPDGFADKRAAWTNTVSLFFRWRFAVALSENWFNDDNQKIAVDLVRETPEDQRAPEAAVDYWSARILLRPLPAPQRAALIDYLVHANDDNYWEYLTRMVQLIVMSPEFQLR